MPSWLPSVSLTLLPHLGGIVGGLITRNQVKNWYDVSITFYYLYKYDDCSHYTCELFDII